MTTNMTGGGNLTKLGQTLNNLKAAGRKGLIVYITAGCPDYPASLAAVLAAAAAGADVVEVGMPFSDPLADGPVIQKAAAFALKAGATTAKTLDMIRQIGRQSAVPLAVMTYTNTVLQYDAAKFARDFAAAGACGLIVPDMPFEESGMLAPACAANGLDLIQFIAPTSTASRIAAICQKASGFLYLISNTGVTGVRDISYSSLEGTISAVRQHTAVPVAIGFGIGSPEAARAAARHADAVIVGSAVVERLMSGGAGAVGEFVAALRRALDERG